MKNYFKKIAIIALLSVFCLGSIAYSADKVIKIGGAIPLSGPVAYWGVCMLQAFEDGVKEINKNGGVKIGDESYKLELVIYDTKNTVADARAATIRLIEQDKVKYIFNQAAQSTIGMLEVSEKAEVISVVACWGYLEKFGKDYPFHFRLEMSDYEMGFAYMPFMLDYYGKDKLKKAAFLGPDDKDGEDCHYSYQRLMDHYNVDQVGVEYFNWEDTDFYPIVTKILKKKPDFIVTSPTPPGMTASIVKAAREMGFKGPIVAPAALETKTILEVAGEYADGVVLPATCVEPVTDVQRTIVKRLTDEYGTFNALAGNYSYWPIALAKAMEDAGTFEDTTAVAEALGKIVLENTYVDRVEFRGANSYGLDRQGVNTCYTTLIEKGKARLADIRFPELPDDY